MAKFSDADLFLVTIGAQKAGTTWLKTALDQSPQVYFRAKEVHYWDVIRPPFSDWDRQGRVQSGKYAKGIFKTLRKVGLPAKVVSSLEHRTRHSGMFASDALDHEAYLEYLAQGYRGQRVISDNTPAYALCNRRTFAEIDRLHPSTHYMFVMRDPVDRLWAATKHRHRFRLRVDPADSAPLHSFRDALEDPYHPDRRRSDYAATLNELYSAVPEERVTCLFFETLFRQDTLDRVCAILGVEPVTLPDKVINEGVKLQSDLDGELAAKARAVFRDTYDFCFERFKEEVPSSWRAGNG